MSRSERIAPSQHDDVVSAESSSTVASVPPHPLIIVRRDEPNPMPNISSPPSNESILFRNRFLQILFRTRFLQRRKQAAALKQVRKKTTRTRTDDIPNTCWAKMRLGGVNIKARQSQE
ncbi:hypothetical protein ACLOJK_017375 [Asimina triloba]